MQPCNTEEFTLPNWIMPTVLQLDSYNPGFLATLLREPSKRRQAIATIAAFEVQITPELAHLALNTPLETLLGACLPQLPEHYLPLILKNNWQVQPKAFYCGLANWLKNQPSRQQLKTLYQMSQFSLSALEVLDRLDPVAIMPATMSFVPNAYNADVMNMQIDFVRRLVPDVTDHQLKQAIKALAFEFEKTFNKLRRDDFILETPPGLANRFYKRINLPRAPLKPHPNLTPLNSAPLLVEAGRKYNNCLEDRILQVLMLRKYYYIWQDAASDSEDICIIELITDDPIGWRIETLEAPSSQDVKPDLAARVKQDLKDAGAIDGPSWIRDDFLCDLFEADAKDFAARWNTLNLRQICFDEKTE